MTHVHPRGKRRKRGGIKRENSCGEKKITPSPPGKGRPGQRTKKNIGGDSVNAEKGGHENWKND